jgi:arylsulfatase A-like enzyme
MSLSRWSFARFALVLRRRAGGRRLAAVTAGMALLVAPAVPAFAAPPNVVVVMADDLDAETLAIAAAYNALPNVQQLASSSVMFSNAFATNPVCAPSRATFLSGRYAHNHGVQKNTPNAAAAFADSATLPTAMQSAGYWTSHVGKYINGYGESPVAQAYVPPGWDDWHATVDPTTYYSYNFLVNSNGALVQYGSSPAEYQTSVLGDLAAASVSRGLATGKPMFLVLTPRAPHNSSNSTGPCPLVGYEALFCGFPMPDVRDKTAKPSLWTTLSNLPLYPLLKPSWNEADVSDKPLAVQRPLMDAAAAQRWAIQYRARYMATLPVDDLVGKVEAALGPAMANTVWIFTSDNGYLAGEHRDAEKMFAYEESARVPLFVSGPGYAARRVDALVANNDLAPTVRDIAGLPADPGADGVSFLPWLLGQTPAWRQRLLIEHWQMPEAALIDPPDFAAVRTGPSDTYPSRLYVEWSDGSLELYDLAADKYETQSLHADSARAPEIAALHATLSALKTCSGNCPVAER